MKLQNTAPLSGLIMAGGFSSRLGRDKFAIPWHGLPQWQYLGNLLSGLELQVYISCRKEQAASLRGPWPLIPDAFGPVGPAGGILSAMEAVPQTAFLVIACDMPLVDAATLRYLAAHRDPHCAVTAFSASGAPHLPEPLAAVWEPAALPVIRSAIREATYSLRGIIKRLGNVLVLTPPRADAMLNVNTNGEFDIVKSLLDKV